MSELGFNAVYASNLAPVSGSIYERGFKRFCDLTLIVLTAPLSLPLIAFLLLLARLDGGPALYGHLRVGQSGKSFRCWKIRTMVPDADARLALLLATDAAAAAEWARDRKLARDPRVTRIGRFLRRTSLDELPQLWNVLIGEMSLVGPRPVTEAELDRYGTGRWAYLAHLPGITGLWQVSGRNGVSYDDRVALDVAYASRLGFLTDLSILLRTGGAVLRRTGL